MDLSRMPDDKKLELCRFYFRAGFALLPFMWLINTIWFYREAFRRPEFQQQKEIRRYVIYSGIGTIVCAIFLVTWIVTFQIKRTAWGRFADDISFIIPLGVP